MLAYRIEINGDRRLVAGLQNLDAANVLLDGNLRKARHRREFRLTVGGHVIPSDIEKHEFVRWDHIDLKVGDTVSISIIETDEVEGADVRYRSDSSEEQHPLSEEEIEQLERRTYERLRKKFEGTG